MLRATTSSSISASMKPSLRATTVVKDRALKCGVSGLPYLIGTGSCHIRRGGQVIMSVVGCYRCRRLCRRCLDSHPPQLCSPLNDAKPDVPIQHGDRCPDYPVGARD